MIRFLIFSVFFQVTFAHANQAIYDAQFEKSLNFMMENMIRPDIAAGAIIAAPSKAHPDYFYHWVRDAALTAEAALDIYKSGYLSDSQSKMLRQFFVDHISFNKHIQKTSLLADGLGEPKFSVTGEVYSFPWGRPQNDGPALRALSLVHILDVATKEKWPEAAQIKKTVYQSEIPTKSLAKADFEYVAHRWQDANFDLWEEVYGLHFYTLMAQRKSLSVGIATANYFLDFGAAKFYNQELQKINADLEKFWDPVQKFILATRFTSNRSKSQLDSAVLLGVLHFNIEDDSFSITDNRVIATFQTLKERFADIYYINKNENLGVAFGRYPEDTYNGYETNGAGNPWVLTTAAAAEFLYRTASEISKMQTLKINSVNEKFFHSLYGTKKVRRGQRFINSDPEFRVLLQNLIAEGDRYLDRVIYHRNTDGSLSEQINRESGYMQGAPNLTWSHASFLTAKIARDRAVTALQNH